MFKEKNILVIGDVMLDAYGFGKVERISPEAPVPVVNLLKEEYRLGGAANVALNLKKLGATPILCALIGDDKEATALNELLQKEDISGATLLICNRPTTTKYRVIGNNIQMLRIDKEEDGLIDNALEQDVLDIILPLVENVDAVIFEDYDKGAITERIIREVIEKANSLGIPIIVDPKKRNFLSYKNVTLFKPNLRELLEGLNKQLPKEWGVEDIEALSQELITALALKYSMITLSDKGILIQSGEESFHAPAHIRNIYDVSGAGDTVTAVASLILASGGSMQETAYLSNLAGGMVCEKVGVMPITSKELFNELERLS